MKCCFGINARAPVKPVILLTRYSSTLYFSIALFGLKKTFQLGLLDTFLIMDKISLYRDIGI